MRNILGNFFWSVLGNLSWNLRIIRSIGSIFYVRYLFAAKGSNIILQIYGKEILVRKGTPDLLVAISSLGGEFEVLKYLFPSDYSGTILDAGGYIGTAAIAIKDLYPNAKIIVIEPSKDNLFILNENLRGIIGITVVHGALIGTPEKSVQLKDRGTGEWGFSVVSESLEDQSDTVLHETPAYRLSDLVGENEKIGLLKLDIEGAEYDLMENDMESLKEVYAVFAELHDQIVPGCVRKFLDFSEARLLIKDKGEKYLSIQYSKNTFRKGF